ncbi:UDP-3-O-(3-hydroxymyristoyl)glucosamine N-acyltransferase [Methylocapsa aurea]|uniref:UDP-3-O-(3-hydroxymyristoyl)glucosamine N-acyltransferase n=1 Tax=Methylocapsa aurea TaxID=663610 RepID=UPI00068DBEC0|nr:UDP-3-O-(3-hydroxymyristoyl)glucosamine N-acyltransferase [Methylocapsa aurea]
MSAPSFFWRGEKLTLADVVAITGVRVAPGADLSILVDCAAPLEDARPGELACFDPPKNCGLPETTRASACFVRARHAVRLPRETLALVTEEPAQAFADVLARIYPAAMRPGSLFAAAGVNPGASIHPEARLEPGVIVDPGVVIGPRAEIGAGSIIAANSVIGPGVRIGRDCSVGAQVTIAHALIGNRVTLHPGARVGQAGLEPSSLGYWNNPLGPPDAPRIGRVIIQDDVEIGANSAIDRGALGDTVIGEAARLGNLVQIGPAVMVGRKCVIGAQVSIASGTRLGDFVAVDRQAGIAAHLQIGAGARIFAQSGVISDAPERARLGGAPARPLRVWLRALAKLGWRPRAGRPAGAGRD